MSGTKSFATPGCCYGKMTVLTALLAIVVVQTVSADEFHFDYTKGDKYRVLSNVDEDVYINRRYSHSARIVNRIAFEVADTRSDGAALLRGDFTTSVQYAGGYSYVADRMYRSEYWHLADGRYEIGAQYFMPTVRNVPTFPDRDLKPGDTWNAPGEERHDFRDDFGIAEPYVIPIDVRYTYEGAGTLDGAPVKLIRAGYTVFFEPGRPRTWTVAYPTQIAGYSDQLLYWDEARGSLTAYEERFKFLFELSDGRTVEYRGVASARVVSESIPAIALIFASSAGSSLEESAVNWMFSMLMVTPRSSIVTLTSLSPETASRTSFSKPARSISSASTTLALATPRYSTVRPSDSSNRNLKRSS